MREILFRGKRKDNGEWVEGYFGVFKDSPQIFVQFTEEQEKQNEGHIFSAIGGVWSEVILETVGQYTGLTDKNGTKIFEGDICKSIDGISLISFDNEIAGFVIRYFDYPPDTLTMDELLDDAEVIGNIHDNLELLKGVEE